MPITNTTAWQDLTQHQAQISRQHLREIFANQPNRASQLSVAAEGIHFDYSKNRISGETIRLLTALAEEAGLRRKIDAMFAGEPINTTEDRAVLHVALRAPAGSTIHFEGQNVCARCPGGSGVDVSVL